MPFNFTLVIWFQLYFGNLVLVEAAAVSHLQATMMVYQAVAEYSVRAKEKESEEYDLLVDVQLPGRPVPAKYQFSRQNYHVTREFKVRTSRNYSANNSCYECSLSAAEGALNRFHRMMLLPINLFSFCH